MFASSFPEQWIFDCAETLGRKVDRGNGGVCVWANPVTNMALAQRILGGWENILLNSFHQAREQAGAASNAAGNES